MLAPAAVERVLTNPYINAKGESDLTATVAAMLSEGGEVRGWVLDGEWLDGGTLEGLLHAQSRLLPGVSGGPIAATDSELSGEIEAAEDAAIAGSTVRGPALIGAGARISGCRLDEVVVGAGAELVDVELTRALVAAGASLHGGSYTDVVVTPTGEVCGPGAA